MNESALGVLRSLSGESELAQPRPDRALVLLRTNERLKQQAVDIAHYAVAAAHSNPEEV